MRQDRSSLCYSESIARIHDATGTRTQCELAAVLGVRQSSVAEAKKRGSIPADWLLTLLRKLRINPEWVLTGEAPKFMVAGDHSDAQGRAVNLFDESLRMFSTCALTRELSRRTRELSVDDLRETRVSSSVA